jgi:hypothetical protein
MYGFDHTELHEYTRRLEERIRQLEGKEADTTFAVCRQIARTVVSNRRIQLARDAHIKNLDRNAQRVADKIDGYDRDDLGESPDF